MKSMPLAALIALQLALAPAAHAKLSQTESGMAKTVEAEGDRSLALLEKLVNQNSGSLNLEGVNAFAAHPMVRPGTSPLLRPIVSIAGAWTTSRPSNDPVGTTRHSKERSHGLGLSCHRRHF